MYSVGFLNTSTTFIEDTIVIFLIFSVVQSLIIAIMFEIFLLTHFFNKSAKYEAFFDSFFEKAAILEKSEF